MLTLDLKKDLVLTDGTYRVTGAAGSQYRLQNQATGEETTQHLADVFSRLVEVPAWTTESPRALDDLEAGQRAYVELWAAHIEEMSTGIRPGHSYPRPEYDPATTSLNERVETKIGQLRAEGKSASRSALLRKKALYETGGAAALIDRRLFKHIGKLDEADPRVIDAITDVISATRNRSTVTQSLLHQNVEKILLDRYKEHSPELPSRATLYRYFNALTKGKSTTGKATNRRSAANTPKDLNKTTRLLLPGEEVQVDSTPMDVLVRVRGVEGGMRPTLTIMVDKATRSIIAFTIRLTASKGYDHALLLAQALVPFPNRPKRREHRALLAARYPHRSFLSNDEREQLDRVRPFIFPRRIVTDNGKDYLSSVFTSACKKFGIDITMSAIHTPTDKPIVERTFNSINTMFTQTLPGYVGNHVVNRGYKVEEDDLLDVATLAELFDDWIAKVWQNRPHSSLLDPHEPTIEYSPNQTYNGAAAYSGVAAYPLTRDDFIDLLPSQHRVIGSTGVQFKNRHFDSDELNPLRHLESNNKKKNRLWEVKFNPYDFTHVWVRSLKNTWIECRWREADVVDRPHFADITNAIRQGRRNELAQQDAARTGTPMPTGRPLEIKPTSPTPTTDTDTDTDSAPNAAALELIEDFDFEELSWEEN